MGRFLIRGVVRVAIFGFLLLCALTCVWFFFPRVLLRPVLTRVAREAYGHDIGVGWAGLEATTPLNFTLSDLSLSHLGHPALTARGVHLEVEVKPLLRGWLFLRAEVDDAWLSLPLLGALKERVNEGGRPSAQEGRGAPWFSLRSSRISTAVLQLGPAEEGMLVINQAVLFTPADAPFGDLRGKARFTLPRSGRGALEARMEKGSGAIDAHLRFEDAPLDEVALAFWEGSRLSGRLDGDLHLHLPPPYLVELSALRGRALLRDGRLSTDGAPLASEGRVAFELAEDGWTLDGSMATHGGQLSARCTFPLDFHRFAAEGALHELPLPTVLERFSRSLAEDARGRVSGRFRGGIEGRRRELLLELDSGDAAIGGYRPASLRTRAVWTREALLLDDFDLRLSTEQRGRIRLRGNACSRPSTDVPFLILSADVEDLPLQRPLHVHVDDRPLRGRISARAFAHVPLERGLASEGHGRLRLSGLTLGQDFLGDLSGEFRVDPERIEIDHLVFEDGPAPVPALDLSLACPARGAAKATVRLAGFSLGATPLGEAKLSLTGTVEGEPPRRAGDAPALTRLLDIVEELRGKGPDLSWQLDGLRLDLDGRPTLETTGSWVGRSSGDGLDLVAATLTLFDAPLRLGGRSADGGLEASFGPLDLGSLADRFLPRDRWTAAGRLHARGRLASSPAGLVATGSIALQGPPVLSYWRKTGETIERSGLELPPTAMTLDGDEEGLRGRSPHLRFLGRRNPIGPAPAWEIDMDGFPGRWRRERLPEGQTILDVETRTSGHIELPADGATPTGRISVSATQVSTAPAAPREGRARLDFGPDGFALHELRLLDGKGTSRLHLALGAHAERGSTIALDLDRFPTDWLAGFGLALPPVDEVDARIRGRLGPLGPRRGQILAALRDPALAPRLLRGAGAELRVEALQARRGGEAVLAISSPFGLRLNRGRLDFDGIKLRMAGKDLDLDGTVHLAGWTDLRMTSDRIPLAVLVEPLWGDRVRDVKGVLSGTLDAKGRIDAPRVRGEIDLDELDLALPFLDTRLAGAVRLRGGSEGLRLRCPGLRLGDRPLLLEADLPMTSWSPEPFSARFSGSKLVVERRGTRVEGIDVDLRVKGTVTPPRARVDASIRIAGGRIALSDAAPIFIARQLLLWKERLGTEENLGAVIGEGNASTPSTHVETASPLSPPVVEGELRLDLPGPLFLRNALMDVAVAAQARVVRRGDGLTTATGELRVTRGSFFLHRTEFRIDRALVRFRPVGAEYEVLHELEARATVRDYEVRLVVKGSAQDPRVELSSSPPLSEAELVHLLSTGVPPSEEISMRSVGSGVSDFYLTSSFNRFLSDALGVSEVRIRRGLDETRIDVDQRLGEKATLSYSRSDQERDSIRLEIRLGGSTTFETGRSREGSQSDSFFGFKRRIRIR